jgi:hypothetical protein
VTAAVFCASVIAIVAVGRWALRQISRGVAMRAVAAVEWQDCDTKDSTKKEWDDGEVEALAAAVEVLAQHEAIPDMDKVETRVDADHIRQWTEDVAADPDIADHLERMERWSS